MLASVQGWINDSPYSSFIKKALTFFGVPVGQENPYPAPFTNKVLEIADHLGWKVTVNSDSYISMLFGLDDERSQLVHLLSITVGGQQALQISSPAVNVKDIKEQDRRDLFNELLQRNSTATNFAWAITETKDSEILIANYELLLETMDVDELSSCVLNVAGVADELEARFGSDNF